MRESNGWSRRVGCLLTLSALAFPLLWGGAQRIDIGERQDKGPTGDSGLTVSLEELLLCSCGR